MTEKQIKVDFGPKKDSTEAAAVQSESQEMKSHEEQLAAKKKTVDEFAAKNDLKGAAAAEAEVLELKKRLPCEAVAASAEVLALRIKELQSISSVVGDEDVAVRVGGDRRRATLREPTWSRT